MSVSTARDETNATDPGYCNGGRKSQLRDMHRKNVVTLPVRTFFVIARGLILTVQCSTVYQTVATRSANLASKTGLVPRLRNSLRNIRIGGRECGHLWILSSQIYYLRLSLPSTQRCQAILALHAENLCMRSQWKYMPSKPLFALLHLPQAKRVHRRSRELAAARKLPQILGVAFSPCRTWPNAMP